MAKYTDYANLTLETINQLTDDSILLAGYFFHNEFTRKQFDAIRAERINGVSLHMRTLALDTLLKYGVITKTRTETFHVYSTSHGWYGVSLPDMTDELYAAMPQSLRDNLDIKCEERKRCYYQVNYDKGEELVVIRDLFKAMFN